MTDLQHPNWRELTQFVRDLSEELMTPQGKIKAEFVNINPALQEAVMQFWAETCELVEKSDGTAVRYGYGISDMSPKDWFNNDLGLRQKWASVIETTYNRYQASVTEAAVKENDIAAELDKLRAEISKLNEAVNTQTTHRDEAKEEMGAGVDAPSTDDEEAEKDAKAEDNEEEEGEG